jgi:ABC-type branched-subunit amino acid transport system substrate-binding protein
MGPGITAKTITLGFHMADSGAAAATAGVSGAPSVTSEQMARAVVDAVNAGGGIAGRRIVPLIRVYDENAANFDTEAQASCAAFTEDARVFAGVTNDPGDVNIFNSCMTKRGAVVVNSSTNSYDDTDFRSWPSFYAPNRLSGSRWAIYVDRLLGTGFLKRGDTVGIVDYDTPTARRVTERVVQPALKRRGFAVAERLTISHVSSIAALSGAASQVSSAILRFRAAGVDRVLFVATGGKAPFLWMSAADAQGYRPRYGLTSDEFLAVIRDNAPAEQLSGARGIGWAPISDVAAPQDPKGRAGHDRCTAVFRKAGLDLNRGAEINAMGICDDVHLLKVGLERAHALTASGLRAAVEGLGKSFHAATVLGSRYAPGRRYGAALVRDIRFDDGCTCFRYDGPARAI